MVAIPHSTHKVEGDEVDDSGPAAESGSGALEEYGKLGDEQQLENDHCRVGCVAGVGKERLGCHGSGGATPASP